VDLVLRDQSSDDIRRWFKALKQVLVVSQPLSHQEALNVLELHICGRLGHYQCNGLPLMNTALDRCPDQRSRTEKALLPVPHQSTNKVRQDIGGVTEGLYLHEQFCPK
jgi:hypothetical protein